MPQPLSAMQQIIKDIVDAGRERMARERLISDRPPPDDASREAVELALMFEKKWSGAPDELLIQLKGRAVPDHCAKLADLLRPARLHVSLMRMENGTHVRKHISHIACFVHVMEPELLEAHLTATSGMTVTLETTL